MDRLRCLWQRDWRWSSVRAHLAGTDDELVTVRPLLDRAWHFADLVATAGEVEPQDSSYSSQGAYLT